MVTQECKTSLSRVLTREQAAEYLAVKVSKIDALVRMKEVPFIKIPAEGKNRKPRYIRFRQSDIDDWLDSLVIGGDQRC
jgi:excisionase family DNA binding protein